MKPQLTAPLILTRLSPSTRRNLDVQHSCQRNRILSTDSPSNMEMRLGDIIDDTWEVRMLSDTAHDPVDFAVQGGICGGLVMIDAWVLRDFLAEEGD